ncbi:MAG: GNAT family N-acetyltransferase [Devosia sp.]
MTHKPRPPFVIRRAEPRDAEALYEICLLTADSGVDASALYSDRRMPGYIWAAPYGKFEPDFAFVLADGDRVVGYVVGTPDTVAFEARLERDWWPKVRQAVAGMTPQKPFDEGVLRRIAAPEKHDIALSEYPAHLHINLLPEAQSGGWGRRMIDTELDALRRAGAKGVQLGVSPSNERAKGFYAHVGFTDISGPGHVTYAMKLR